MSMSLDALPTEILLLIFGYLPVLNQWKCVRLVSRKFRRLLGNDRHWQLLLNRYAIVYPSTLTDSSVESFSYARACWMVETERRRWLSRRKSLQIADAMLSNGHTATVDAIHIVPGTGGRICVSGSRDRSMCVWDLHKAKNWQVNMK
jgi:hypothetical protein